jgi:hypothetical protein
VVNQSVSDSIAAVQRARALVAAPSQLVPTQALADLLDAYENMSAIFAFAIASAGEEQ